MEFEYFSLVPKVDSFWTELLPLGLNALDDAFLETKLGNTVFAAKPIQHDAIVYMAIQPLLPVKSC